MKVSASSAKPILSELLSSKPGFFHDDNRAGLFEVHPDSGKLLNVDIQASKLLESKLSIYHSFLLFSNIYDPS
jgi:hypothetical protein